MSRPACVRIWTETVVLPTYLPALPDRNPMFLEQRVYQGSSGRVYPLPFTDRIANDPVERRWQAVWIENEFLRAQVLPELGGRIHVLQDKTNGYDLIYRQTVIKPALVGLAGPWISGGIEFNWPQHHRPATFLPVEFDIENHADGSKTIWCSDHDPMARMKGLHGVCLHPGQARLELKVRAHNRTPFVQTFLWWANVATRVHEGYQSFFPPDVDCVADHAKRATSAYPLCQGAYYGVDYGERGRNGVLTDEAPRQFVPPHCRTESGLANRRSGEVHAGAAPLPDYAPNDLSFYANIPTPCSYMCVGSRQDFFGGYDYFAHAGIVHLANHHLSPGKKQWTWGNHNFGYAWDRNLTDPDRHGECAPYIEIMAGVYTDNQPDFSFLHPGETKTWSQYWYPIQKIGPPQHANLDAAVRLVLGPKRFQLGVGVTREFPRATVRLERSGSAAEWTADLAPGKPFVLDSPQAAKPWKVGPTTLRVLDRNRRPIIVYQPQPRGEGKVPSPATEPPAPPDLQSLDELYLTGLHLEQYRHATRCPTLYWREALRRDPLDARCNNALGRWHLHRGEFARAEAHFRQAIERLTRRNPNPYDGEPHYHLGLCLRFQLDAERSDGPRPHPTGRRASLAHAEPPASTRFADAYAAFYKATWNQAWTAAAYHALAELDGRLGHWLSALDHLDRSLRFNTENLRARDLKAIVLRKLDRAAEADALLRETLALDPLDAWARHLAGRGTTSDPQTALDLAHDYARAGLYPDAIELLNAVASSKPARPSTIAAKAGSADRGQGTGDAALLPTQSWGAAPLVQYTLGWLHERAAVGFAAARQARALKAARQHYERAAALSPDYCFPARIEEIAVLEAAMRARPADPRAPYYLGNLLYDRRRHAEAIALWERSATQDPGYSVVWRNLGIGYFNLHRPPAKARAAYERAVRAAPRDARVLYERDQLWKRLGDPPRRRLRALEQRLDLVRQRDDLSVELCALYNQTGRHEDALALVRSRHFQPWEGGEGQALGQHVRTHLALGRRALAQNAPAEAREHFEAALAVPPNLGEAKHLLANQSDIHYWLGWANAALGEETVARSHWLAAATCQGDFQAMSVRRFSEMTYYSALAWACLGRKAKAERLLQDLLAYARQLKATEARVDYFATSLPTMLLFDDDLQYRQETNALFLQAQAALGLGQRTKGRAWLAQVLRRDPNHALAADLLEVPVFH